MVPAIHSKGLSLSSSDPNVLYGFGRQLALARSTIALCCLKSSRITESGVVHGCNLYRECNGLPYT